MRRRAWRPSPRRPPSSCCPASFGYSLSTTHVATGSIIGTGLGKKGAEVRWNVAGRMATAWLFTLPAAALVGAGGYALAHVTGGNAGVIVDLVILIAVAGTIYCRSRSRPRSDHDNVNDEWTGSVGCRDRARGRARRSMSVRENEL